MRRPDSSGGDSGLILTKFYFLEVLDFNANKLLVLKTSHGLAFHGLLCSARVKSCGIKNACKFDMPY